MFLNAWQIILKTNIILQETIKILDLSMVSKNIVLQIVICTLLLFFVAYFSAGIVLNENSVVYAKPFIIPLFVFLCLAKA